jgi:uncharacterized protein YndB with AHSA1/START domain
MRKVLMVLLALLGALFVVVIGGGLIIDGNIALGIEKRIAAPPDTIFSFLDNAAGLDTWWKSGDQSAQPQMKFDVKKKSGPEKGAGLVVDFESEGKVFETWTIKSSDPPRQIVYDVDFGGAFQVERTLTLTEDGDATRVKWHETGVIKNPAMRWFKVMMPPETIIKNFEMALGALEKAAQRSGKG